MAFDTGERGGCGLGGDVMTSAVPGRVEGSVVSNESCRWGALKPTWTLYGRALTISGAPPGFIRGE